MFKKTSLTHERLVSVLAYNKSTGIFTWKKQYHVSKIGRQAGSRCRYLHIKIDGEAYKSHRLAWFYVTGKWPELEIDHRDGDKFNNRWRNLRQATREQNSHNNLPQKGKLYTSLKGVTWAKERSKWLANIRVQGRLLFIGYFDSAQKAHRAYAARAKELRGEFARAA